MLPQSPRAWLMLAVVPLVVTLIAVGAQYLIMPTSLRIAVTGTNEDNVKIVGAVAQVLARERTPFRLKIVTTPNAAEAASLLDRGEADLAVSRADVAVPRQGDVVAILHRDPVIIVAKARSELKKVADLRGKTIAIPPNLGGNQAVLKQLLAYYDIPIDSVRIELLTLNDLPQALREDRIDAAVFIQPPGSKLLREAINAFASEGGGPPRFIGIAEAKAIAQRNPAIEEDEILPGAFGGNPLQPEELTKTVSVSYRIFARRDLSEASIADFTRLLFTYKVAIAGEVPLGGRLEAPNTDRAAAFPVHTGAIAYYDGEVKTFMERWGDWFYIGAILLGFGGSVIAAMFGRESMRSRREAGELLNRLLVMLEQARRAGTPAALDAIDREADEIFATTMHNAVENKLDPALMSALSLSVDQVRRAVEEKRRILS